MRVNVSGPRARSGPAAGPRRYLTRAVLGFGLALAASISPAAAPQQAPALVRATTPVSARATLDRYCVTCHNARVRSGELVLDSLDPSNVAAAPATWEKVVRKVRGGAMPPAGMPRPDEATAAALVSDLTTALD